MYVRIANGMARYRLQVHMYLHSYAQRRLITVKIRREFYLFSLDFRKTTVERMPSAAPTTNATSKAPAKETDSMVRLHIAPAQKHQS